MEFFAIIERETLLDNDEMISMRVKPWVKHENDRREIAKHHNFSSLREENNVKYFKGGLLIFMAPKDVFLFGFFITAVAIKATNSGMSSILISEVISQYPARNAVRKNLALMQFLQHLFALITLRNILPPVNLCFKLFNVLHALTFYCRKFRAIDLESFSLHARIFMIRAVCKRLSNNSFAFWHFLYGAIKHKLTEWRNRLLLVLRCCSNASQRCQLQRSSLSLYCVWQIWRGSTNILRWNFIN